MPNAPEWMRANARRGLGWYKDGYAGDGLTDKTVRAARDMADGRVSDAKARDMLAWFARHMVDLEGTSKDTFPPTPGMVAHALWGGWPADESRRAQRWAEEQSRGDNMHDIERRSAACSWEIRETSDGVVGLSGYAAVFDSEAHGEVVRRSAFNKTLQEGADVRFLINHDGLPLARRNGSESDTMRLRVDNVGLRMEIDSLDMSSPVVQSLVSAIKRGDIDQMSFAFMAVRDNYTPDGVRELTEVKLVDVSAVTYPWYEQTSIGMKSDDRELVEARDVGDVLNTGEPMLFGTDTDVLSDKIAAVDAAIDAAQTLLGQYGDTDPIIAQAYALLCAAYSALEDVEEALGIADPDDMLNEMQPVDLAPDEPQIGAPMRAASDLPNIRAHALDALRRIVSRA